MMARLTPHAGTWWRWATLGALLVTVPAFYVELGSPHPPAWAAATYLLAALLLGAAAWVHRRQWHHPLVRLDALLALGLAVAAAAPPSSTSQAALAWRLGTAFLALLVVVWRFKHRITRGGVVYIMLVAAGVLLLCGVGYWWLEPNTPTLGDGLWLAFTTAATVGYGDVVPSTPASRIFSVFVVLLGFGVLTLATAAIATTWIETEERRIEREILRDLHHQMGTLHAEIARLREELRQGGKPPPG